MSDYSLRISNHLLQELHDIVSPRSAIDTIILACVLLIGLTCASRGLLWDKPDPFYHVYFERPQTAHVGHSQAKTRNIAHRLAETEKDCVILWGSQSGTAEGFANRLAADLRKYFGLSALSADLSDFDASSMTELEEQHLAFFLMSTFGEGDPTDNACETLAWLSKEQDPVLSNLRYMALGLGNSNYKYYNRVVDVLTDRLGKLQAQALLPTAHADDAYGTTEEDFITWRSSVFHTLSAQLGFTKSVAKYRPTLVLAPTEDSNSVTEKVTLFTSSIRNRATNHSSPIVHLPVILSYELFKESSRRCIHLELDISQHPEIHYKTGDHFELYPSNPIAEIDLLIRGLGQELQKDIVYAIQSEDDSSATKLPSKASLSTLLHRSLDICARVPRDIVSDLTQFAPSKDAADFLSSLSSEKGIYTNYLKHNHITFGRLLHLASPGKPWKNLPLSFVFERLPIMQPRYYSISSSSVVSPKRVALTILVSEHTLEANPNQPAEHSNSILGLASNYALAVHHAGDKRPTTELKPAYDLTDSFLTVEQENFWRVASIYGQVRRSKFKLPISSTTPIIMIAAGTGLAPFRAFIAERVKMRTANKQIGTMRLYFGCRRASEDFIYRDELEQAERILNEDKTKMTTRVAFSRQPPQKKTYVQDCVADDADELLRLLIEQDARLYVCGRTAMARDISKCMVSTAIEYRGMSESEAKDWADTLRRSGKWKEDVWG